MSRSSRLAALCAGAFALGASALPALAQVGEIRVVAGGPTPSSSSLTYYIANAAGFFKQDGLETSINYATNASAATQIISAGNGDISLMTFEPTILGYEKGIRGKILLSIYSKLIYKVGLPDPSPVKEMKDLKGKTIGVSNLGSSALPIVTSMMAMAGVKRDDYTIAPVGVADQAVAALQSDRVQALALWDSAYATIERNKAVKLTYVEHPTLGDFGNGGYFASNAAVEGKRDALCAFGRGIIKSIVFMKENPEAAVRIYWKANPAAKPEGPEDQAMARSVGEVKFLAAAYSDVVDSEFGKIDEGKFKQYVGLFKEEKLITAEPPVSDILTNDFVKCTNDFNLEEVRAFARNWKE